MTSRMKLPEGLRDLLARLKTYDVVWNFEFVPRDDEAYEIGTDREVADLEKANVVSSQIKMTETLEGMIGKKHVVAIDLDIPAYLVPSSTRDHGHLYIDVPGGIPHEDYMELLDVLAKCRIIEPGYAEVSKKRGHSDLRLPWVKKEDQKVLTPEESQRIWEERNKAARATSDPDPWDTASLTPTGSPDVFPF